MKNFIEKLKAYYRNSPRHIGWTWFLVHLFFLFVGMAIVSVENGISGLHPEDFQTAVPMILLFPVAIFMVMDRDLPRMADFLPIVCVIGYYVLFAILVIKAKNTGSRVFRNLCILFTVLFLVNIINSLYFVLHLFPLR